MPTTFEIHPAIGIARAGNSPDCFVGPEPDGTPPPHYRDSHGGLLRQAARFRVYECVRDAHGALQSATEVTASQGHVTWTVHLTNRKAAAPVFPPLASRRPRAGTNLRNPGHAHRADLVVDPGPSTLAGPGLVAPFSSGTFLGTAVPLGEMRTEADGRLLVLGGFGKSGSVSTPPTPITHFANNDSWFDDMSDGPVTATVTLASSRQAVAAKPAWVIVAPPDFAPGVTNAVTLYDVAVEAAVERSWRKVPTPPSFTQDIQPILQRAVGYQWVLDLGRMGHGPGSMGDFTVQWPTLADPTSTGSSTRQLVFSVLRDPAAPAAASDAGFMPRLHNSDYASFPTDVLRFTATQYAMLKQWSAGQFVDDLTHPPVSRELLPDALDRVALQACSGGPFFPGIEVGRVMADAQTYSEPFRVDASKFQPGDLTAGNAVPWQADFLACSTDPQPQLGWWPAQRPYQVLVKVGAPGSRFWSRGVSSYQGMVDEWHELGVVVLVTPPHGSPVFVESERRLPG